MVKYNINSITGYKDLLGRKEIREAAWRKPGWDECVAYTGNCFYFHAKHIQEGAF